MGAGWKAEVAGWRLENGWGSVGWEVEYPVGQGGICCGEDCRCDSRGCCSVGTEGPGRLSCG